MLRWQSIISTFFIIGILKDFTQSLRLVEVRIPNYVIKGSTAQLECLYDLDGEALYSVKWYKDGNEFYRYVPRDMPPAQTFLLPGVSVDLHNSSDAIVTLRNVNLQSAGRFRCEVSGEAPSFQTVTEHGDMVVVSLPDQGPPKINGGRARYQIGDWVRINCTAGRSKPAVQLSWFVNGEPAEPHQMHKYETIVSGREGLETSVLGLQFRVEQQHFRNGDMKLKCVASLSTFYWRSNEESVEGDRPQKAPVLESRETVYASNSRADPVQASKTDSLVVAHAPSLWLLLGLATLATLAGTKPRLGARTTNVLEEEKRKQMQTETETEKEIEREKEKEREGEKTTEKPPQQCQMFGQHVAAGRELERGWIVDGQEDDEHVENANANRVDDNDDVHDDDDDDDVGDDDDDNDVVKEIVQTQVMSNNQRKLMLSRKSSSKKTQCPPPKSTHSTQSLSLSCHNSSSVPFLSAVVVVAAAAMQEAHNGQQQQQQQAQQTLLAAR